jgi:hypothetical protein
MTEADMSSPNLPPEEARDVPSSMGTVDADTVIRLFNEASEANEDLCERVGHAADRARRTLATYELLRQYAVRARQGWRTAQAEHPERRGWLPLMAGIAAALLALDSWAAYFAAEALGGDQHVTLLWAALFLVILALLETALARFAERNRALFALSGTGLGLFAILLSVLRFGFFVGIGTSVVEAAAGAVVFTICTVMFVLGGFAAVRYAETLQMWQARSSARRAAGKAAKAEAAADRWARERDQRVDAYVGRIRPLILRECSGAHAMEDQVRARLLGVQQP